MKFKTSTIKKLALAVGFTLTLSNTNAQTGAALNIGGNNDYVVYPHDPVLNVSKFTIETWLKWGSSGTTVEFITSKGADVMEIHTGGALNNNIRFIPTTGVYLDGGANTITPGTWVHLACVYDPSIALAKMYVNGIDVPLTISGPNPLTTAVVNNAISSHIGARPFQGFFFNGSIDEFRIWNTARTQCEINTFMNCEIPTTASGLVLNYHFNQGIASGTNTAVNTLTDFSGSALTGTLISVALTGTTSNWVAPGGVVSNFTTPLALPSYTASSLAICQGNTVSLTSTNANTYTWSGSIINGVAFTPTASTAYNYTGTNTLSTCSATAVANVTVNLLPLVAATSNNTIICVGQSASLTASGASSYTWNTTATTNVIAVSPTTTTTYTVIGVNANGCSKTATVTQNVSACTGINQIANSTNELIVYPNPFNTQITIVSTESKQNVQVYNTIGLVVYDATIENDKIEIDLSHQANGIYFVRIGSVIKKIIKE